MSSDEEAPDREEEEEEEEEDFNEFAAFKRARQEALLEEDDEEEGGPVLQTKGFARPLLKKPYVMQPEEQVIDDVSALFILAMHCFDYIEATQGVTVRNQKKGLDRTFDF